MRNDEAWYRFVRRGRTSGPLEVSLDWLPEQSEIGISGCLTIHSPLNFATGERFHFAAAPVTAPQAETRSGEPCPPLGKVDQTLRCLRARHPGYPLLVFGEPRGRWSRSFCWMLGEYLAERNLPLWINLPETLNAVSVPDLVRNLRDCGLSGSRLILKGSGTLPFHGERLLSGSGTFLLFPSTDRPGPQDRLLLSQF